MSHTPHELSEEFPEFAEKMSVLKASDVHFANPWHQVVDVAGIEVATGV